MKKIRKYTAVIIAVSTFFSSPVIHQCPAQNNAADQKDNGESAARHTSFETRNSAPNIEKLGKSFFSLVKLNEPYLKPIKALVDQKKYQEALKAYRTHFFRHLRKMDFPRHAHLYQAFVDYSLPPQKAKADELMVGIKVIPIDGKDTKVKIGEPGSVNWSYLVDFNNAPRQFPSCDMIDLPTYTDLLEKAYASRDLKYMNRWCEYMDDLSLNIYNVPQKDALDCGYNGATLFGSTDFIKIIYDLTRISKVLSEEATEFPETSLARFLTMIINYYLPDNIVRVRVHPQNHAIATPMSYTISSRILKDFYWGDFLLTEGWQRGDTYFAQQMYLDGVDRQKTLNYDDMLMRHMAEAIQITNVYCPGFYSGNEKVYLDDEQFRRANYYVRMLQSKGNWPFYALPEYDRLFATSDRKTYNNTLMEIVPRAYSDPVTSAILSVTMGDKRKTPYRLPPINSDGFPYGGYYFIREGWKPEDQYGLMVATDDGEVIGRVAANLFVLSAFNQYMVTNDTGGWYADQSAPLSVNGFQPLPDIGKLGPGHMKLSIVRDKPNPFRNHNSKHFDLMEGIYDGYFAYKGQSPRNPTSQVEAFTKGIKDPVHNRQVVFLRDFGIWIVRDGINAQAPYDYTLDWRLYSKEEGEKIEKRFTYQNIRVDTIDHIVETHDAGMANLSMYMVGDKPFTLKKSLEVLNTSSWGGVPFKNTKIRSTFSGQKNLALVTVFNPRKDLGINNVTAIRKMRIPNVVGLELDLKNGARVSYITTSEENSVKMNWKGLEANGQVLLVQEQGDQYKGVCLGCTDFKFEGNVVKAGVSDFEFEVSRGSTIEVTPIYRPVDQVKIYPESNVFADKVTVSLKHELGRDVDILYSKDGSEPSLESPATLLYDRPFSISGTTMIKARAIRKGISSTPQTLLSTHVSVTATAEYNKAPMKPSLSLNRRKVTPGLSYRYYDVEKSKWALLFNHTEKADGQMAPRKQGACKLMDITGADVTKPFAFDYDGYIDIPADGDYTFYLPDEMIRHNINAGYNLVLYVDGEKWNPVYRRHAVGTYTVPLSKGFHRFEVRYTDFRTDKAVVKILAEKEMVILKFNRDNPVKNFGPLLPDYVWSGSKPDILISGPSIDKQVIPDYMLYTKK